MAPRDDTKSWEGSYPEYGLTPNGEPAPDARWAVDLAHRTVTELPMRRPGRPGWSG